MSKSPFNSPLETGLRSLVLLNISFPASIDLSRLVDFDYLFIHSSDADGPSSLHPDLPYRTGELLVRRRLIEKGLLLMINKKLVKRRATQNGIQYQATENTNAFLDSIGTMYLKKLNERADWVISNFGDKSDERMQEIINSFFDKWTTKFERSNERL